MTTITPTRLRELGAAWHVTLNKYRGAAPLGFAVAHMASTVPARARRAVGIMRVPLLTGQGYGYSEAMLEDPTRNIYVWGLLTNQISAELHRRFATSWATPNPDFWLSVRLSYLMGFTSYTMLHKLALPTTAEVTATAGAVTSALVSWIRDTMLNTQRFGKLTARDLRRTADELELFSKAMALLDSAPYVAFTAAPPVTPGGASEIARVAKVRS